MSSHRLKRLASARPEGGIEKQKQLLLAYNNRILAWTEFAFRIALNLRYNLWGFSGIEPRTVYYRPLTLILRDVCVYRFI